MTRKEEITRAADAASQYESPSFFEAFVAGAEWADRHPQKPITISDLDKAMVESKIVEDLLIERACEWLGNINLAHYFYGRKYIKDGIEGMEFLFTPNFYNDFKKAMKNES